MPYFWKITSPNKDNSCSILVHETGSLPTCLIIYNAKESGRGISAPKIFGGSVIMNISVQAHQCQIMRSSERGSFGKLTPRAWVCKQWTRRSFGETKYALMVQTHSTRRYSFQMGASSREEIASSWNQAVKSSLRPSSVLSSRWTRLEKKCASVYGCLKVCQCRKQQDAVILLSSD